MMNIICKKVIEFQRLLLTVLLFIGSLGVLCAQTLKIVTYNIRYDNPEDGENRWSLRKEFLSNQLKFYGPDVFGVQEALRHQVDYLDSALLGFQYVGVGRDDGESRGEYSALFYNMNKFELIDESTFWLSETPDKPSVGWDASMERICTYALLRDKRTNSHFWVFNTHFDHIGEIARKNSAYLIVGKMKMLNLRSYPMVLMGDLNLEPQDETIKFLSDTFDDAKYASELVDFGPDGTFNGFKFDEPVKRRIDYIFVDKEKINVQKYAVLSDSKDMKYPSDHLPVYIEMTINN